MELEYKLGHSKNVALEDQFAACFEFVDKHLSFQKDYMERYLDNYCSIISPFTSREIRENRITLFWRRYEKCRW